MNRGSVLVVLAMSFLAAGCATTDAYTGLPVLDLEPSLEAQLAFLTAKYPKSDVLAMYLIRQLYQKQREFRDNGVPIDVDQYLGSFVGRTPLVGLVPQGQSPRTVLEAYLGDSFSESWFTADLSQRSERIFVMMGSDHIPRQRVRLEEPYRARS